MAIRVCTSKFVFDARCGARCWPESGAITDLAYSLSPDRNRTLEARIISESIALAQARGSNALPDEGFMKDVEDGIAERSEHGTHPTGSELSRFGLLEMLMKDA